MKHLLTTIALLAVCAGASAQTKAGYVEYWKGVNVKYSDICFTPSKYSLNNKPILYYYGRGEDDDTYNDYMFDIYDDDITKQRSFTVPALVFNGYTEIGAWPSTEVPVLLYSSSYPETTSTLEEAQTYITSYRGHPIRETVETDEAYLFYLQSSSAYYMYSVYGYQYPVEYYRLIKATSVLERVSDYYNTVPGYEASAIWTTERNDIEFRYIGIISATLMEDGSSSHGTYVFFTQTFFNQDEAFEYLAPIYTMGSRYEEESAWDNITQSEVVVKKYHYYEPICTGVNIMSENGSTLATISFDSDFYPAIGYDQSFYQILIDLGGKKYMAFMGTLDKGSNEYVDAYAIYSIDTQTHAVQKVAVNEGMRVSPTMAHRSDMITVELEGDSNKARQIRVVNAAGQTVKRVTVPAGQRSIQINAADLSQGLNVINVEGEKMNTCKILVR